MGSETVSCFTCFHSISSTARLQVLVAGRNRLATLPSLHLPFLRELWLGSNRLSSIAAWPWLPSLRLLQLEGNQLAQVAPMQASQR